VSSSERFDDNAMIQELVAAGEGVAVVPRLTIDTADPRIAVFPVPELPPRRLAIVTHAERRLRPAAQRLIDTVLEVCADREASGAELQAMNAS
jgi:DNA-binding transcriptional LysR family regulator